jgi:hypothetical protein
MKYARIVLIIVLISLLTMISIGIGCTGSGGNGNGDGNGDTTPPIISDVSVADITTTTAIITWTTDEPSDSAVDYGLTASYGATSSNLMTESNTSHSISLSGLIADTTYHYRVKSRDAAGNETASGNGNFSTIGTIVTFPDENLEEEIRTAIGRPEGDIHASDLEELTGLVGTRRDITDITGLEQKTSPA